MLMWCFEDASGYLEYFLNTDTGELFPEDELLGWGKGEKVSDDPSLVSVPCANPAEGFRDMEDFVFGVEDAACRSTLGRALGGRGSFSRFRDALSSIAARCCSHSGGGVGSGRAAPGAAPAGRRPNTPELNTPT